MHCVSNPPFSCLDSHSIPLLDYSEIHLWGYLTLHARSERGTKPVLNGKSAGRDGERTGLMPACLPGEEYDSELETAKTKKRTVFALCALCTDTAEHHPKTWLIPVMYHLSFSPWLPLSFSFFTPILMRKGALYHISLSLWKSVQTQDIRHKYQCKFTAHVTLSDNVFQSQFASEPPSQLISTVCLFYGNTKWLTYWCWYSSWGDSWWSSMHRF